MKRSKLSISLIFVMLMLFSSVLCSCDMINQENKSPSELIEDAFGNKEFNISFSSETLDKPIEDMIYSANQIPLLPTPQKVGYIFEGWYMDSEFTVPYTDGALRLCMQDVTLYPKWSKETFRHNGTYDVEFTAKIVEGSVVKGETTDLYGGYNDFSDAIVHDECYIEKNDDELLLKLQYDTKVTTPWQSKGQVYTVRMNKAMDTDIYVKNKLDSFSDPVKTLFILINDWDLSSTLYLDIDWVNFENKDLNESDRYTTLTSYTVAIDLTKIIGFSRAFVDTSVPLEKGYYLAKSFFRKENNEPVMGQAINPTYSYLYSDGNENYQLITQGTPYLGLVEGRHPLFDPMMDNFYDFMSVFSASPTLFDVESRGAVGTIESEYFPQTYNGGYYRKTVCEFHADTGKVYNIYDIDTDLTKEYLALTAVSGYMEREGGMGYVKQLLSIDYRNIIKLAEVDYTPLEGDCYEYEDEFCFYPGAYSDLDQKNMTLDTMRKFGTCIEMADFYFTAPSIESDFKNRKFLSSRIEVTPTKKTNGMKVSDSRYVIGEFDVNTKVYGYDVRDGQKLFVDRMCPQVFEKSEAYNSQLREVGEIRMGQSCKVGDTIDLAELFRTKINKIINFTDVTYKGYEIHNNKVNFDRPVQINGTKFQFSKNMAVEFTYRTDKGLITTVYELKQIAPPTIEVHDKFRWKRGEDGHYTKTELTKVGDTIPYPDVRYQWGEHEARLVDNFYEQSDSVSINPAKSAIFSDGKGYNKLYLTLSHQSTFELPERNIFLMYEINNEYGERDYLYFHYNSDPRESFEIHDESGNLVVADDIKYKKADDSKNAPMVRISVYSSVTYDTVYDKFNASHIHQYTHTEGGFTDAYNLLYYSVYSDRGQLMDMSYQGAAKTLETINDYLADKAYGCVTFIYGHDYDRLEVNYLYKVTFNGIKQSQALSFDAYFTETPYTFGRTDLIGSNMEKLATVSVKVDKFVDDRPIHQNSGLYDYRLDMQGHQFEIIFRTPGKYRIQLEYRIRSSVMGNPNEQYKTVRYNQFVDVNSHMSDIQITYKTDKLHPFRGGALEKTVTYNLAEGLNMLAFDKDAFDAKEFAEGREFDRLQLWSTTGNTYGITYKPKEYLSGREFIDEFNSQHIVLNAIWEIKFRVECDINGTIDYVTGTLNDGSYVIYFPPVRRNLIPKDHVFAGWTGGFIGSGVTTEGSAKIPYRDDYYDIEKYREYFKIKAVFKKQYQVDFEVDLSIANRISSAIVLDGDTIENSSSKMHVVLKDKSYRFVGYYLKGDPSEKTVNLATYVVHQDTVFVAKFEKVNS